MSGRGRFISASCENPLPFFPDHDPGTGRVNMDLDLVRGPLDFHLGDACMMQVLFYVFSDPQVFMQKLRVLLLREPL